MYSNNYMKTKVSACLVSLLCIVSVVSAVSASEIRIVGNEAKIPKIYWEQGQAKGILIDIARCIDKKLDDHEFVYELYPWARAYAMAERGDAGIIGLSKTKKRLDIFDYSDVIYYDEVIVVVKKGNAFSFNAIEDLRGKTVGIGRHGTFGDVFDDAVRSGLIIVEEDNGDVPRLKKVLAGRIDCALISPGAYALERTVAEDALLTAHKDQFVVLPKPFKRDPNYLGFAKSMGMKDFLDAFNAALEQARESGEIQAIIDAHQ